MFCRNCGKEVNAQAVACVSCGLSPTNGERFCQNCGADTQAGAIICTKCGVQLSHPGLRSKLVATLFAIFLGWLGIHRFYLGFTGIGVAQLVLGLLGYVTCGVTTSIAALWGIIEGVLIISGSMNRDARGMPLRD